MREIGRSGLKLLPAVAIILFVVSHDSRVFGTAEYQIAAKTLLSGQSYYGYINFDERSFEQLMAAGMRGLPLDVLVAGSSRAMQLEPDCFDGKYYNASVSGANLSDAAALVEEFRSGRRLKQVVFTADPWLLSAYSESKIGDGDRNPAAEDWIGAQLRLGFTPAGADWLALTRAKLEPLRELLAPSAYQKAWKGWIDGRLPPSTHNDLFRKDPDGSLRFPDAIVNARESDIDEGARGAGQSHLEQVYRNYTRIDPYLQSVFEALTLDLKNSGVKVELLLCPFHPLYYGTVVHSGGGKMLPVVEQYFRDWGAKQGFSVIGAYDPALAGALATDFIDGVHLKKAPLKRLAGCREGPRP